MSDYGLGYPEDYERREVDGEKDPDAIQDYKFVYILGSDTILTSDFILDGVTEHSSYFDDTSATIFLSGGSAGTTATVTHEITTNEGRTFNKSVRIRIRDL